MWDLSNEKDRAHASPGAHITRAEPSRRRERPREAEAVGEQAQSPHKADVPFRTHKADERKCGRPQQHI